MNRIVCALLIALAGTAAWSQNLQVIEGNHQLLSEELRQKLPSLWTEYGECIWPTDNELQQHGVPLATIAPGVTDDALGWIGRTIKPEWMPEGLGAHFVAFRREYRAVPPVMLDYLAVRHQLAEHDVQVLENGLAVGVLVTPHEPASQMTAPREYLIESAGRFLQLPEDRIASIAFEPTTVTFGEAGQLHYGIIRYQDADEDAARTWWHQLFCWTDSTSVYFEYPELTGEESGLGVASAASWDPSRF